MASLRYGRQLGLDLKPAFETRRSARTAVR